MTPSASGYPGQFIINTGPAVPQSQVFVPTNHTQFINTGPRPFRPKGPEYVPGSQAGNLRPEQPSPNMLTGLPILAHTPPQPPGPGYPAFPQPVVQVGGPSGHYVQQNPPFASRVVMPNVMGPMAIMPNSAMTGSGPAHSIDTISPASSLPSAFHQVPASHGGSSQPPSLTQTNTMWGGVMSTPSPHLPGHTGTANQTSGPPHNPTPPANPTPNPSPGPTLMYGHPGHTPQANSLPTAQIPGPAGTTHYPPMLIVNPQGFHHGMIPTSGPHMGGPSAPGHAPVMGGPGAPPTSMSNMVGAPHFQYMQHQGQPTHLPAMMGHHNQQ